MKALKSCLSQSIVRKCERFKLFESEYDFTFDLNFEFNLAFGLT